MTITIATTTIILQVSMVLKSRKLLLVRMEVPFAFEKLYRYYYLQQGGKPPLQHNEINAC